MNKLKETLLKIYSEQKGLLTLMAVLLVLGVIALIYFMVAIDPDSAVMKIGYGDIGGYRDGTWTDMLAFPILAVVFGVLHNFLAMKIFEKQGSGVAKVFVVVSLVLLVGTFIVFLRLLGES